MSGSTSTAWSLPLTLRVNFWAMSAVSSWMARDARDGAGSPVRCSWFVAYLAPLREPAGRARPSGTLMQAGADWNGYNDEILTVERWRCLSRTAWSRHSVADADCTRLRRAVRLRGGMAPGGCGHEALCRL